MSTIASMINLEYDKRLIFAVPVPRWSIQHELVINSASSWVKYPSPKGWDWLKLPLNEQYVIIGLSTPKGFRQTDGTFLKDGNEIYGTIIRGHIVDHAAKYDVLHVEDNIYLVVEMFL